MIKYLILIITLFVFCNTLSPEKKYYKQVFYTYTSYQLQNEIEGNNTNNFHSEEARSTNNDSRYQYCIISLAISLVVFFLSIYYSYKQLTKTKQSIQHKDNIIKRMEDDFVNNRKMIETCRVTNKEMLDVYMRIVQLSVSPKKRHHQKFLLDYNSIIYNNSEEFQFDWETFRVLFNNTFNYYIDKLKTIFPDLSEKEVQAISMQKAGFDIADIAQIFEYSVNTIYKRNSDIRKKLGVPELGNIIHFIDHELRQKI